jgi:hypothetical protein
MIEDILLESLLSNHTRAFVGLLSSRLEIHGNTFSIAARDVEREVDHFSASTVSMYEIVAFETLTRAISVLDPEIALLL